MPVIALILSLLFLALAITPTTSPTPPLESQARAVIAFITTPLSVYSFYIYSGIKKIEGRFYYQEPEKTGKKLLTIILIMTAISHLFKGLTK
ncbi:MAG: hypothetical protein ACK4FF_02800 [Limnobacter sp.]|uniref:hypothetical protein n=1 Tax=Limnobacter sp. TaxID=2003368 RepID=UPI00391CFFF8